jgi:hypothetical protein
MAGVSKQCVANYYKAWQLAAEDGKCLRAEELAPGEEDLADLEENDDHTREEWSKYLQMAKEPREPRETGRPQGAKTSSAEAAEPTTPQTKAAKAVKAVVDTAEQFHKKLSQVLDSVGPTLMGEDAGVAAFAEQLRQARFELDKHCQEIDRLLDRIGYGDTEAQPEGADA